MSVSKTRELGDDKSGSPSAKRSSGAGASYIPSKGERVEQKRSGIARSGTVWYADQLQMLVKWDSGASSSLRLSSAKLSVIDPEQPDPHRSQLNRRNAESCDGSGPRSPRVPVGPIDG